MIKKSKKEVDNLLGVSRNLEASDPYASNKQVRCASGDGMLSVVILAGELGTVFPASPCYTTAIDLV